MEEKCSLIPAPSKPHQLKYIVLSDLHLGEEDSLFTQQADGDYELLNTFSDCLAELLHHFNGDDELPAVILNGDILGLSFSNYQEALQAFEHFAASITVHNKICDQVAYIPGNHDHHIWQQAMEDDYLRRLKERKPGTPIPELMTSTPPLFEDGIGSSFFEAFMQGQGGAPPELKVFYPNFLLPSPGDDAPFILFHHGHFAEDTYHFVTNSMRALYPELQPPTEAHQLEHQNGAWIDFVFSQLGRSGEAGRYFEKLMQTLSSKKLLEKEKGKLAENVAKAINFPYLPFKWMEKYLAKRLIVNIADQVRSERYKGGTSCSDETIQNLMRYFEHFCLPALKENGWENEPVQFVWSHTHKPFEKNTQSEVFGDLKITNTGGWVLPPAVSPMHGASVVLINQANDVQSLRIFMDTEGQEKGVFRVLPPEGEELSGFGRAIHENLYAEDGTLQPVWARFKRQLEDEIKQRREE